MRTVAIIQARMGSKRLPGKSAARLGEHSLLWHVLDRVKRAKLIDQIVLALPAEKESPLGLYAAEHGLPAITVLGNPNDLMRRYALVSKWFGATTVVRIPGDNPCVDPNEIDRIITFYRMNEPKWWWLTTTLDQNVGNNGYPGGLGAEVYHPKYFHEGVKTGDPVYLEHPHKWAFARGHVKTLQCPDFLFGPQFKFSVDTLGEFQQMERLYKELPSMFTGEQAVEWMKRYATTDSNTIGQASINLQRDPPIK